MEARHLLFPSMFLTDRQPVCSSCSIEPDSAVDVWTRPQRYESMQADRVDWTEDSDARLMQATLPRLAARPATDQVFFFFFFFFFFFASLDR